jgi:short-subunit dehydrogenase
METKIAIVTGANGGMGRVITEEISRNGYEVVMACRDLHKSEPVYREIVEKTGGKIVLLPLDLSSIESVNQFITEIKYRYKAVHLLIHNAGVMAKRGINTSCSLEQTFMVNYLSPYILTRSLAKTLGELIRQPLLHKIRAPLRLQTLRSLKRTPSSTT